MKTTAEGGKVVAKAVTQDRTELILSGSMYKVLFTLSTPIIINSLISQLYSLVDSLWVSKISSVHFAAVAFVWPVNWFFIALGNGLPVAGTALLSQLVGAGQLERARKYAAQLFALALIASLAMAALGYLSAPTVVRLMGAAGDLERLSLTYLRIVFCDLPFVFLYFAVNALLHAQGDTLTPMILSGASALLNAILDPIFIFMFGWGLAGAAWATVLSRAVLAVVGSLLLLRSSRRLQPDFTGFRLNKEIVREIVRIGLPSSVGQAGASLGFAAFNGFIAAYGTATLAAYGMVNRITSLVMQPATGMGQALTAIVGQNIGAAQMARVKEAFHKALTVAVLIGIAGCAVLIVFDEPIIYFFMRARDDPAVITESLEYLAYVAVSLPFMGIFGTFSGLYQGSGSTRYSMNMEMGRLWLVRLPLIVLLGRFTNWGSTGIWFSMSFSNVLTCLYGYWVYKTRPWQKSIIAGKKETGAKPLSTAG